MNRQLHLIIRGRVQGVFFRSEAQKKAFEFSIAGWVRNTSEGHVEILAQGEDNDLNLFLEWCKKGPSRAKVEDVEIETSFLVEKFMEFGIR